LHDPFWGKVKVRGFSVKPDYNTTTPPNFAPFRETPDRGDASMKKDGPRGEAWSVHFEGDSIAS